MLYASVILSGLVLSWGVYSKDIYDKEPESLLGLALLLRMATGWAIGFLEDSLINRWSREVISRPAGSRNGAGRSRCYSGRHPNHRIEMLLNGV